MYFVEEEYEEEKVKAPVRTLLGCGKMAEMLLQKYPLQRYPWTRDVGTTNTLGERLALGGTGVEQPLALENGNNSLVSGGSGGYIYGPSSGKNSGTSTPIGSVASYSSRGITAEKSVSISSRGENNSIISSKGGMSSRDDPFNDTLRAQQPLQLPLQPQQRQPQPQRQPRGK